MPSKGLYLSNLPYTVNQADVLKFLQDVCPQELEQALTTNEFEVRIFSRGRSGKSEDVQAACVYGITVRLGQLLEKARRVKINGRDVRIKFDLGDQRDEFGQFMEKFTPRQKRMRDRLQGVTVRKATVALDQNFINTFIKVYDCKTSTLFAILEGLNLDTLDSAGTVVAIHPIKHFYRIEYSSVLECIQAISLFNNKKTPNGTICFTNRDGCLQYGSELTRGKGIGKMEKFNCLKEGTILNISSLIEVHGYVDLNLLDPEIVDFEKLQSLKSFCWKCEGKFTIFGVCANLSYLAGKCTKCSYGSSLPPMDKARAFSWQNESFTRLTLGPHDRNREYNEVVIFHSPMKYNYVNAMEYREIVGPILMEEWKYNSRGFKETNTIHNGTVVNCILIEECLSKKKKEVAVFHTELVIPKTEFWSEDNKFEIRNVTLYLDISNQHGTLRHKEIRRGKVTQIASQNASHLRAYIRIELPLNHWPENQRNVKVVPKPIKLEYRSTLQTLNHWVKNNEKYPSLEYLINGNSITLALPKLDKKPIGLKKQRLERMLRRLNQQQMQCIEMAKSSSTSGIHGPPGTGKTFTLAVLSNLFGLTENGKILACAPSNFATTGLANSISRISKIFNFNLNVLRIFSKAKEDDFNRKKSVDVELDAVAVLHDEVRKHPDYLKDPILKDIAQKVLADEHHLLKQKERFILAEHITCIERKIIDRYDILASTISALNDRRIMEWNKGTKISTILVDESGQLQQPSVPFLYMFEQQRTVFAGDHLQLKPQINSWAAASAGLEISAMEWFEISHMPWTMLKEQHRMEPNIRMIVSEVSYKNQLLDAPSISSRNNTIPRSVFKVLPEVEDASVIFFNHTCLEEKKPGGTSFKNVGEATLVQKLVKDLVNGSLLPTNITILTFYDLQKKLLASNLKEFTNKGTMVANVDGYQGKENDVVILSMVRSNVHKQIGFVSIINRLNVAISRAKFKLIICGNLELFSSYKNQGWKLFSTAIKKHAKIVTVKASVV